MKWWLSKQRETENISGGVENKKKKKEGGGAPV